MDFTFFLVSLLFTLFPLEVFAESHTIRFVNNCGKGAPHVKNTKQGLLFSGTEAAVQEYTINGPLDSAIAFLDTDCDVNGERCITVEMNLNNPTCGGCGPQVDLSLIIPLAFSVPTSFAFYGGDSTPFAASGSCDGLGMGCTSANCDTAFHTPTDNFVQQHCDAANINLLLTFCGDVSTKTNANPGSLSSLSSSGPAKPPNGGKSPSSTQDGNGNPPAQTAPATTVASPSTTIQSPTTTGLSNGPRMCSKRRKRSLSLAARDNSPAPLLEREFGAHARAQHGARSFGGFTH